MGGSQSTLSGMVAQAKACGSVSVNKMTGSKFNTSRDPALARYSRQMLYEKIGEEGQRKLRSARGVLIGCGAIGSVQADILVRAGIGTLKICDRDFVEYDNLQRQVLFDENDVRENIPKAEAAARKLRRINSDVTVEPIVCDVNHTNIERLAEGYDIILDGTDNFETRYLINDLAVKTNRPWVYGAVVGVTGLCMTVIPHDTPCLRCVFEQAPPADMNPTCDTAGVLMPTVNMVGSWQAIEVIKLLTGNADQINRHLVQLDLWSGRVINLNVGAGGDGEKCPCCQRGEFPYLNGDTVSSTTTLCGRNAVQIRPATSQRIDFDIIAEKLEAVANGSVARNRFLIRATIGDHELTVFADGRAIIKGTEDQDQARSLYAKFVGA